MSYERGSLVAPIGSDHQIVLAQRETAGPYPNLGAAGGADWTVNGGLTAGVASLPGRGVLVDASGEYLLGPSDAALGNPAWTSLTLMAWVYFTGTPNLYGAIFHKSTAAGSYPGGTISFGANGSNRVPLFVKGSNLAPGSLAAPLGRWSHYVGRFDGSSNTATTFLDGVPVGSAVAGSGLDWGDATAQAQPWYLGDVDDGTRAFRGIISDARVISRALSDDEIMNFYRRQ